MYSKYPYATEYFKQDCDIAFYAKIPQRWVSFKDYHGGCIVV